MRHLPISLLIGLAFACAPAFAGETAAPPGTTVEMPILIAPMIVNGQLNGYAYVSSAILATSPAAAIEVRAKTPFIQDAFVRDVNGASIVKAEATDTLDSDGLIARLLADVQRVVGQKKVSGVRLTQVQISPLRTNPGG